MLHSADGPTLARLGRELTAPGTEIKVTGSTAPLGPAWQSYPLGHVMTTPLTTAAVAMPRPYRGRVVAEGAVLLGLVLDAGGEVAASGRLAPYGRFGVVDQVGTQPAHRRRGLGTAVMGMLGNAAVDAGLTTGLLSATDDGRALYRRLGWDDAGELAGAFRRPYGDRV